MPFRTIQRADLLVAILIPPAVIAAWVGDRIPNLIITAAAVAAFRAIMLRSVVAAYKAGIQQERSRERDEEDELTRRRQGRTN